jgi:raffinose/stachyose/melibiose transport system permease protein
MTPAAAAPVPSSERPVARRRSRTPWLAIFAFLAPALLLYIGFTIYPALRTFYNSVHTIKPRGVVVFVGLANFRELLGADPVFWKAVRNTMLWGVVAPIPDVLVGLLLALCLYAKVPLARLFRVVWFMPVLLSYVVVGIIWMWVYNYEWGVANQLLREIGLSSLAHSWLGDPATARWAVMFTHVWKWVGFNMVVCLAALYALPTEILEAAALDNCGWLRRLIFVMIPMTWRTLLNLLVLSFIGKMRVFDLVWIMTGGGPLWSTETVSTYLYKRAFEWNTFDLGYPSSIAALWFVVVLAFVLALTVLFRQREQLEY